MDLALTIFLVLLIMVGIMAACEAFTNAIEWLGKQLNLSEGAVGSVLAAIGTALPETIIPLIAIAGAWFGGHPAGTPIGLGAIVGAPFMLSTLAMFVTGAAVVVFARQGRRSPDIRIDPIVMARDLRYFLVTYGLMIAASFLPWHPVKIGLGIGLLGLYGYYVYQTLKQPGELGEDLEPLYFARKSELPPMGLVLLQLLASLVGIIGGAHLFVIEVTRLSGLLHVAPLLLSLIVTPLATELPEKFNSVIWIFVRKDTLALGNITGAMVFQSCIPVAIGLWMTPWVLSPVTLVSAAIALLSAGWLYFEVARRSTNSFWSLWRGGAFYLLFLGAVIWGRI